jgi:hypothetical protein
MKKILFALCVSAVFVNTTYAQEKKLPLAIGFTYERMQDSKKNFHYANGVSAEYLTKRDRYAVEVLYGLSARVNMKSAIGLSNYNSELLVSTTTSPYRLGIQIYSPNVFVSQTLLYDVIQWSCTDFLIIKVSPFITLDYEHFLGKREETTGGTSDLNSESADRNMEFDDLPATWSEKQKPAGIFSGAGGLAVEAIFKKTGFSYQLGYNHSFGSHSKIDTQFKYKDNEIHTLNLKSKDSGISHKISVRYYF